MNTTILKALIGGGSVAVILSAGCKHLDSQNQMFASDAYPTCASAASDVDGDGWGWENNLSCKINSTENTSAKNALDSSKFFHKFPLAKIENSYVSADVRRPIGYMIEVNQEKLFVSFSAFGSNKLTLDLATGTIFVDDTLAAPIKEEIAVFENDGDKAKYQQKLAEISNMLKEIDQRQKIAGLSEAQKYIASVTSSSK